MIVASATRPCWSTSALTTTEVEMRRLMARDGYGTGSSDWSTGGLTPGSLGSATTGPGVGAGVAAGAAAAAAAPDVSCGAGRALAGGLSGVGVGVGVAVDGGSGVGVGV